MQKEKLLWKFLFIFIIYLIPIGIATLVCVFNWGRWQNWLMCVIAGACALIISTLTRVFVIGMSEGLGK